MSEDPSESKWLRVLLDRFQTSFSKLGVFSSLHDNFYSHLVCAAGSIENATGLSADIQKIKSGTNNYIAEFEPSFTASHDDYDHSSTLQQWIPSLRLANKLCFSLQQERRSSSLTAVEIKDALFKTLSKMSTHDESLDIVVYDTVIVGLWLLGTVVESWDGEQTLSVNLFPDQDHYLSHKDFKKALGPKL